MSSMRRVLKKLDRYVCAADVFEIYEDDYEPGDMDFAEERF